MIGIGCKRWMEYTMGINDVLFFNRIIFRLKKKKKELTGHVVDRDNKNTMKQTSCKQCGICCTKGGAALHSEDLSLLRLKKISRKNLITIRKGEFAYNPVTEKVQATRNEIVKLCGTGREWTCCYYDVNSRGCTIYDHRPLACRALKCWDPADSLALVETDLLSRFDILEQDVLLHELIAEYETACPLPDFTFLSKKIKKQDSNCLISLEASVNQDLEFRNRFVQGEATVLQEEMFLFGRPLFQLLQSFGVLVYQAGNRLRLQRQEKR